jgi:hypothetical protein
MKYHTRIDLHMHTTLSDGTDPPEEIPARVKEAGITLFSVTDHDSVKSARIIAPLLREGDPEFLPGAEFSCRDEDGKYHILGYGYDPDTKAMKDLAELGHSFRMNKVKARLEYLKTQFGFTFPEEELRQLLAMDNPGKPHIGNLMVKMGYARSKEQAIKEFIDRIRFRNEYVRPEEAVRGILGAGGVPVLAHPSYGDGDQLILGQDMERRLQKLVAFGLQGVEGFYSGFTPKLRREILDLAERYGLYVTAGSDYHGKNKLVPLGDTGLESDLEWPEGLKRFVEDIGKKLKP